MTEPIHPVVPAATLKDRAFPIFLGVGGVLLAGCVVLLFARLWPIAILLTISLMMVAALTPIVTRMRKRYTRKIATTLVVLTLLFGTLVLVAITIPPIAKQLTTVSETFTKVYQQIQAHLNESSPALAKLFGQLKVASMPDGPEPQAAKELFLTAFTVITGFVTVLMLTLYFVIHGHLVATALVSVFPRRNRLQVRQLFGEIGDQVGTYIRGQLFTSSLTGLATFGVLAALGVPNALALAWIMAVADVIPIAGLILGIIPAVVSAYAVSEQTAIFVLIILIGYHQLESYWIIPRVYGRVLKLSPLVVLISIMVGTSLLGIVGALIAMPIAAAMPILLRHFHQWRKMDQDTQPAPVEVLIVR